MVVALRVIHGPVEGERLVLPTGEHLVGRGADCRIRPRSEWVSRRHCLLRVTEEALYVRDLGSRNGTLLNGHQVLGERRLVPGDRLWVGPLVLEVEPTGAWRRCPECGLAYHDGDAVVGPCPGCQAQSGVALGQPASAAAS